MTETDDPILSFTALNVFQLSTFNFQLPAMARIVQKYGGTSVGDVDRIKNVANRTNDFRDEGNEVGVVVSARAGVTNELVARAKAVNPNPSEREMDQLLSIGEQEAIALTLMAL